MFHIGVAAENIFVQINPTIRRQKGPSELLE